MEDENLPPALKNILQPGRSSLPREISTVVTNEKKGQPPPESGWTFDTQSETLQALLHNEPVPFYIAT